MRTLLYETLVAALAGTDVADRVYSAGRVPATPEKPFVAFGALTTDALRYAAVSPASDAELQPWQVFVYDEEDSYLRIDELVRTIERAIKALAGVDSSTGARCLGVSWGGVSQDFKATEYEAAARFATFSLTGSHHKEA